MRPHLRCSLMLLLLCAAAPAARADGGVMLLHGDAGPFTLSLFAAQQPLVTGKADLSVMVQSRATGEWLQDPQIQIEAEGNAGPPATVQLLRANNQLLPTAALDFPHAGPWQLTIVVRRGMEVARLSTQLTVRQDTSRTALLWFYLALPLAVILLFLLQQHLKG